MVFFRVLTPPLSIKSPYLFLPHQLLIVDFEKKKTVSVSCLFTVPSAKEKDSRNRSMGEAVHHPGVVVAVKIHI